MCAQDTQFDVRASILKHVGMLRPVFPKRVLISIGDYASALLRKTASSDENGDILTLFIEKSKEQASKRRKSVSKGKGGNVVIDDKVDTHYWFDVQKYVAEHDEVVEKLRNEPIDKLDGALMVASIGEGLGSALLVDLASHFKEGSVNSVAFAVMPSALQPPDVHFNSLWSVSMCASKGLTQVLIGRDDLEGYVGVDRKGIPLRGNAALNYLVEMALAKKAFVQEFSGLSKSYNLKMFTVLSATGASLRVYGSVKNILDSAKLRPLAPFDLSDASMLYVVVRMPYHLREKLTRARIELAVDEWFKEKSSLKVAYVGEPIYVDDGSDRIDILMFVGGFSLDGMVTSTDKKVKEIKAYAAKVGSIKEKEWQELIGYLLK